MSKTKKNEGNDLIFSREIKPLIFGVFKGVTPMLFAYVEHKGVERQMDFLCFVRFSKMGFL